MPTVGEVIRRILPHGTNPAPPAEPALLDWRAPPLWPPDLFAVAATLSTLSGAYAHAAVTGGTRASAPGAADFVARVEELGAVWRLLDEERMGEAMARVQELWTVLLDAGPLPVSEHPGPGASPWCAAALELMAIADEASAGIGFDTAASPIFSAMVAERHFSAMVANWRSGPASLEEAPLRADRTTATLCILVPPEECCVQPKARTPQVGCTPRSLTHHLALLPPLGEVTTSYLLSPKPTAGDRLNLLLVPYPFSMGAGAFEPTELHADEGWGRFRIRQDWFPPGDPERSGRLIATFLGELVAEARRRGDGEVHAVVLPELALDAERALIVGQELARTGIDLFVSGVLTPGPDGHPPRNDVMSVLYQDEAVLTYWEQSKHHRWRLERGQIEAYGLPLDPARLWWEDADVSARHVRFYGFHEGATLATLVCEDLARIDPVQPVLRAVGPNLVVALLMDGPQMSFRWPARYATVLAEDPGSTVVTITSAGLVDRHIATAVAAKRPPMERAIGLWKDASSSTRQLVLAPESHGVLVRASLVWVEERTMDRRSDGCATREIRWGDMLQVTHPAPPDWLTPIASLTSVR
ncbi:MAG TPA: hypothetical protein VEB43_00725 [Anaeromyxobacter sp.]|nr:hypothetical protein [Anaeromyxobacter sp.]